MNTTGEDRKVLPFFVVTGIFRFCHSEEARMADAGISWYDVYFCTAGR